MERKHPNLYKRLLASRKRIFERWYEFTKNITWLEKVIYFQHRYFPIPLFLYDYIFRFNVINSSAEEFINSEQKFDILITSGEVFAYFEPKLVDYIIQKLKQKGVKIVVIHNEGSMTEDILWPDGTYEYNFKRRLMESGFADKQFYYEEHESKVVKYIVMC